MNEYYISPAWVYWANAANTISVLCAILSFLALFAAVAFFCIWRCKESEGYLGAEKEAVFYKKCLLTTSAVFLILLFASILIPTKDVLIEMAVAKIATKENVGLAVEKAKEIVDYVVKAIKG